MKRLLLLGGISYLIPYIKAAHELGAYVITCDYLPDNIAHKYSDEYCNVSIVDKEAVLKAARELKIDGIMSPATDPGVTTCAYVAEKLGLPGCPYQSVDILQHKDKFRKFLRDNGFNAPRSEGFTNEKLAIDTARTFRLPFIIKPTDSAGSKGVTRINSYDQIPEAVKMAFNGSISKSIIIEDFIEKVGSSSDTDSFSVDSKLVFCSLNCQYFDPEAANPYTPAAYTWPSDMPGNVQDDLRSEIQRLISLLHMGTSLYNIETRMSTDGKGYIMELSPRAGGNRLSEVLRLATGQDLITNAVKAALGMPVDSLTNPEYHGVWAEYIIHSNKAGKYQGIQLDPEFEKNHVVEKDYWLHKGDQVYTFTGANRAIGTLIMKFNSHDEAAEAVQHMNRYLKVELIED
jgi:biotin carboxylase